jgi:hypothetical protein
MPSQVRFHNKYVNIRDNEVVLLLHTLLESVARLERDEWAGRVRAAWEARLTGCGFGCYDLDLDELVRTQKEKERMLELFAATRKGVSARGSVLKKEWLNSLDPREAIYSEDQPTTRFLSKLDEIAELLV